MQSSESDVDMFDKMLEVIGETPFESNDLKLAGYLLFKKLAAFAIYNPDKKIKGPVTLIKATENFIPMENDHSLSKVQDLSISLFLSCYYIFFIIQYVSIILLFSFLYLLRTKVVTIQRNINMYIIFFTIIHFVNHMFEYLQYLDLFSDLYATGQGRRSVR